MNYFLGIFDSVQKVTTDPDAAAFFLRVSSAGGTLTATEKTSINNLVVSLKFNNLWLSMSAIYPMVGASAAACAQNLVSSSFTGSFSGGWTYASTGVTPNGTNAYMNTGLNCLSVLTSTNIHLSVYSRTDNPITFCDIGVRDATFGYYLYADYNNANTYLCWNNYK
jgi:hypothetical protein